MPGNMWDEPEVAPSDLELRLNRVAAAPGPDEATFRILLETTRGNIEGLMHPVEGGSGAVVCAGGAMGGLDGPANKLYPRIAKLLAGHSITTFRVDYRIPNNFEECVLDVLAACSFLQGIGAADIALVGHSFGGAVVIKAGQLFPAVRGVASLSPQLFGTRQVDQLAKPLLLIHGAADTVLASEASEDIYRRARDPRRIVLFADTGHSLREAARQIDSVLVPWLLGRLSDERMESGRDELFADPPEPDPA
jgi:pimeloyl-ACP methyl ester carboxylesterase